MFCATSCQRATTQRRTTTCRSVCQRTHCTTSTGPNLRTSRPSTETTTSRTTVLPSPSCGSPVSVRPDSRAHSVFGLYTLLCTSRSTYLCDEDARPTTSTQDPDFTQAPFTIHSGRATDLPRSPNSSTRSPRHVRVLVHRRDGPGKASIATLCWRGHSKK